ncbi:MAG: cation-translocating P-type ATPase [Gammaproteobacteria bacterium]|nr:cation-translocating P-type ATPase [Gammaproteobacteria bacterium]
MATDIQKISGLSSKDAALRLRRDGFNELPQTRQSPLFIFILKLFREPMFLLLLGGVALYFILGDIAESMMLLVFVIVIMGITCYQEYRSEKAIIALRNLSSPRAFVIRDGKGIRIAGREVVSGDIIVLNEGDAVPADAKLFSVTNLLVNESILTGESQAVRKSSVDETDTRDIVRSGGDDLPFVYSGTQVVQGNGYAKVIATGINTEMGRIGVSLNTLSTDRTRLQKETDSLVRNFAIFGFIICALVVIIYGVTRMDWLQGSLVGITLAMAILPEELPVVITVFLALGTRRIALSKVLTREIPAVEALGSATVLCVDKTGTITQNRMTVSQLFDGDDSSGVFGSTLSENFHQLMEYGVLASQRDPFDQMEIAIKSFGECYLKNSEHWHQSWQLIHQYPLSRKLLAMSQVWESTNGKHYVIAAKGAPEDIFELCHLDQNKIKEIQSEVEVMAHKGLRVIGVAKASFPQKKLPDGQHDFNFEFLGLIGLEDPIRPNVFESVRSCYQAGIRVIMITGDYLSTAKEIASQIGLNAAKGAFTGDELAQISDEDLEKRIKDINIFARILPEQKLRIVNALKANGEVVAMTGDGVNDAPALKSANIGVAMGGRGTDVARESAGLVLLNDDFSSLVTSIRLGRRIYTNIKKAMVYLLAVHLPIICLTAIPVIFKWPLLLWPIHIVFLQLIIDPTCSIVFEAAPEEADIMMCPPRRSKEKLFNRRSVFLGLMQGFGVLVLSLGALLVTKFLGWSETDTRALVFAVLVISNIALIFVNLSEHFSLANRDILSNRVLWIVVFTTLSFLTAVLTIPTLKELFYF